VLGTAEPVNGYYPAPSMISETADSGRCPR
jgi:hypothetical protein